MPWVRPDGGPALPGADREVILAMGAGTSVVRYQVRTAPAKLDVHLDVDTTASMGGEITALQSSLGNEVVPAVRALVADSAFGVSSFEDFPSYPFGTSGVDRPFTLMQRITTDADAAIAAVFRLDDVMGVGGDLPESGFEALYQVATGAGYVAPLEGLLVPSGPNGPGVGTGPLGGVGFREGSFRVLVHATDAPSHVPSDYDAVYPGTRGGDEAADALTALAVKVVGIASGEAARSHLVDVALATGSVGLPVAGTCPTGIGGALYAPVRGVCPLVYDIDSNGAGLSDTIVDAITVLLADVTYDAVTCRVSDDRLGFVQYVEAERATPPSGVSAPTRADGTPTDGVPDTFRTVRAGTTLEFAVHLRNDLFPSLDYAQTFRLRLRVVAGEVTLVDETLRVIVPASL